MELQDPTNFLKKIQNNAATFQDSEDIYLPSPQSNPSPSSLNPVPLIEGNIQKHKDNKESSKTKYSKISNIKRKELIEAVENQGEKLKDAALRLDLNYSSAKSIIRVFKKEGRSNKKPAKNRYTNKPKPEVSQDQANLELPLDNLTPLYSLPFVEDNNSPYMKKSLQSEAIILTEPKNLEELRAELLKSQLGKRLQTNDFYENPLIKKQAVPTEYSEFKDPFQQFIPILDSDLKTQQAQDHYGSKELINLSSIPIATSDTLNKNLSYPYNYETAGDYNNFTASPSQLNQMSHHQGTQILEPPLHPSNQYYTMVLPNNQIPFPLGLPYNFMPNPNIAQLQGHMPMQQIIILTPVMPVGPHQQINFLNQPYVPEGNFNQQQNVGMTFPENPDQGMSHPNL